MISLIAAVGKNNELGLDNKLLWHLPEDMKYFRDVTRNHTVIMGRKTYESIGRILPNRTNYIITSQNLKVDGAIVVSNPEDIPNVTNEVFVIGGASIYKYYLPKAEKIYLTETSYEGPADVYFPAFDKTLYTKEIVSSGEEGNIKYSFVLYKKK